MRHTSFLLLTLAATLAAAQDPAPEHDLRASYRYRTGDRVRITERTLQRQEVRVRRGTLVEERERGREGVEQRYVLEVLEATEEGDLVRGVRTYEALKLVEGEEVAVEGLRVLLKQGEEGLEAVPEHGTELPPELAALLEDLGDGSGAAAHSAALFPEAPQPVGGTWTLEPEAVAQAFDLGLERLTTQSKVTGALRAATPRPGASPLLRSEVVVALRARGFNGLSAAEQPFACDLRCTLERPADAADAAQTLQVSGTLRGRAPSPAADGTILELDLDLELSLTREVLP